MFLLLLLFLFNFVFSSSTTNIKCKPLPSHWTGNWYQNKDIDYLNINQTNFINHGNCVEQKEDKFVFYNR